MSQNHFTLRFPLKSPADAKAVAEQLPPLMVTMSKAQDAIGTVHYSRFTILSDKTNKAVSAVALRQQRTFSSWADRGGEAFGYTACQQPSAASATE